jgi:hypothetical protein
VGFNEHVLPYSIKDPLYGIMLSQLGLLGAGRLWKLLETLPRRLGR